MTTNLKSNTASKLLLSAIVGGGVLVLAHAQPVPGKAEPAAPTTKSRVVPYRYQTRPAANLPRKQFAKVWGVDSLSVKSVESGDLIRFTYRVLDPEKAKALWGRKNSPSLIDPDAGVKLPAALQANTGELGQNDEPDVGSVYAMAFLNVGGHVRRGHRVDVIVGQFRAAGLLVQ